MSNSYDIDDLKRTTPSGLAYVLWAVIGFSLVVHVGCFVAGQTVMEGWRWPHHPVHAAVEMSGGLIALWVAWMLLSLERRNSGTNFNVWISGALIGMGFLDGFHAVVHAGQAFVWLHSTATFVGGVLFACVWLPSHWSRSVIKWWPWAVMTLTILFGSWSLAYPDRTPAMLIAGSHGEMQFSPWARGLNIAGGILLFAAAGRIVRSYFVTRNIDDLLFCLHSALFGAAAIMFEQSQLWDLPWWGWHLLRLMAYAVALWFVVLTELRTQHQLFATTAELQTLNAELEARVAARTEQLAGSNEALNRSNQDLQQFAYVASHDLQTPLRSIAGFAQFLKEDYGEKLNEEALEYIEQIISGAVRMQALITDLLTYARVDSRARPFAPVDLNATVDDAVAALDLELRECSGVVTHEELPTIAGDRSQLQQLFQNLIGNALKYHGDSPPEVHISAVQCEDSWMVSVKDNGIGIDAKHHQRIFEIFRRLHTQQAYPGTGIGLALCRRVVERHGGGLNVESEEGRGSTFHLTLPVAVNSVD